jgi:hypothetical protein
MTYQIPNVPRTNNEKEINRWRNEVKNYVVDTKNHISSLPIYASNALALAGGLAVGDFYQTGDDPSLVCVVV